jgi:hypothetical protein
MPSLNEIGSGSTIVKNGGPATQFKWSGDNSTTWVKGQLLREAAGVIARVASGATTIPVATVPLTNVTRLFIALEDVPTATAGNVAVQEILVDTVLQGPMSNNVTADFVPVTARSNVNDTCLCYQSALGIFGVLDPGTAAAGTHTCQIVEISDDFTNQPKDGSIPWNRDGDFGIDVRIAAGHVRDGMTDNPQWVGVDGVSDGCYNICRFKFRPGIFTVT